MTTSSQIPAPHGPFRAPELGIQRPLPAGVVGLPGSERAQPPARPDKAQSGTLLVGQGIEVKGKIESCDTLVVEGRVEASVAANTLEVLNAGLFKGTAEVKTAGIAGTFEGNLTVKEHLAIKASGRVSGTIRYAHISIEKGGEIAGEVQSATAEPVGMAQAKGHVA
ncbi:MAG: polymer-forming cytoskeletal protein [Kiloniellaceae bacterium]